MDTPKLDNWLDRENADPVFVRMRDIADDQRPHLFGFAPDTSEIVGLHNQALESIKAENRSEGAQKAAKTRIRNAERGISQVGLKGTSKQKQWAAELRMKLTAGLSDEDRELLYDRVAHATWWTDRRDLLNDFTRVDRISAHARNYRKKLAVIEAARAGLKAAVEKAGYQDGQILPWPVNEAITAFNAATAAARKYFEPKR
ncbi:hypothetical protein HPT29_018585 [Microvirga terrae]|uniref:Uncharacterized protein n=1 Tax=Microvirga terrae TaxID=2740529 RepID=A0ABY5RMQ0_9HYPH|nr:hypothetical protein [Microvirga terrae]UVF18480.1 hypothetical protein HPT29_018585 [Microvirga terrae]